MRAMMNNQTLRDIEDAKRVYRESYQRLQQLYTDVDMTLCQLQDSPDLTSHLSAYLLLRSCSHVELSFQQSVYCYVRNRSHRHVANLLVNKIFSTGFNPKPKRITELLLKLNNETGEAFDQYLDDDSHDNNYKNLLDNMVQKRNNIAHGQRYTSSFQNTIPYYSMSLDVAEWLFNHLT